MKRSGMTSALCLAGWLLAPAGASAQQFLSTETPIQQLGGYAPPAAVTVQCKVKEWGTLPPAPSQLTVQGATAGFFTNITPGSFCLRCPQNPTNEQTISAAITVPTGAGMYLATLRIQNANNSSEVGDCSWSFTSYGLPDIKDAVKFVGDPKYYNPAVFSPVTGGLPLPYPSTFYPIQFTADFFDQPPSSSVVSWTWSIDLQFMGGSYKLPVGSSLGSQYVIGAPFTLPDKPWVRDANGNILTKVQVTAKTSDGYLPTAVRMAGIQTPPNKPRLAARMVCSSRVDLAWEAGSATGYEVHYGPSAGPPYTGTGAAQGSSPIQVGTAQLLHLTGLSPASYFFSVRASNQQGTSPYADPMSIPAYLAIQGPVVYTAGNVVLLDVMKTISVGGTVTVNPGAVVQLRAGESVLLSPGFQAVSGSSFRAIAEPCL